MSNSSRTITTTKLPSRSPNPTNSKDHHIDSKPSGFKNPWPSWPPRKLSFSEILYLRFGSHDEKNNIPVPQGPNGTRSEELVRILPKLTWGSGDSTRLRATWIGHSSFLVETPGLIKGATRGVRILFDPVFAERTSPFTWIGPKRYTPPPCTAEDLPDVDVICISHSHYDHLDIKTVKQLYAKLKGRVVFVVPLKLKKWFLKNIRCQDDDVVELDWWESCRVSTEDYGSIDIVGCPAQHGSGRTIWDTGRTLWCGFSIECRNLDDPERDRRLYYAGDTAYQAVSAPSPCPAFKEIGSTLGPFDLAFIPIGLYSPPSFMSAVHVTPEQALSIHKDVQAKRSLGMHYGTVRGGISKAFEDVRDPPRRWREIAEKEGLWLGGGVEGEGSSADWTGNGVGLCDIGETVAV